MQGNGSAVPPWAVIKMQAIIRGFLARRRVKNVYGFQMTPGLLRRAVVEMDPAKLEEQRQKVQEIRKLLPAFEYGVYDEEDNEAGVNVEKRDMQVLADNAQYEGEWNVDSDTRHGRGY